MDKCLRRSTRIARCLASKTEGEAVSRPRKRLKRASNASSPAQAPAQGQSDVQPFQDVTNASAAAAPAKKTRKESASKDLEAALHQQGHTSVAGTDEAGRGPLAGPVVAAACHIPLDVDIDWIRDSKKLTPARRKLVFTELTTHPRIRWAIKVVDAGVIDKINILRAALDAMGGAASAMPGPAVDYLLVDGPYLPQGWDTTRAQAVVRGDSKCYAIAAASIIAKVTRDRLMDDYDVQWPQYGFASHKGYGTREHMQAIRLHGPCPIHRMTFAPLKANSSRPAPKTSRRKNGLQLPKDCAPC
ncbi:hypothetical protein WJX84_009435 [Apatococcus fuscideae]|uniref:Ribonuclease n=1 Tax=Apatococcus fuscideae TaxID=2026836 RepID=A0AAW1TEN7_9CHLO